MHPKLDTSTICTEKMKLKSTSTLQNCRGEYVCSMYVTVYTYVLCRERKEKKEKKKKEYGRLG